MSCEVWSLSIPGGAPMIELGQLENHLWESANILRGPVDAADFKTYIFPLLFFKRISDVYDEEVEEALSESDGDQQYALFPENHRFQIPDDCHWKDVRSKTTNVGKALQRAFREIEKANPDTLYGIFGDAQWTNKDRLSDALLRGPDRTFFKASFGQQFHGCRRSRASLRIPDQEICRREPIRRQVNSIRLVPLSS